MWVRVFPVVHKLLFTEVRRRSAQIRNQHGIYTARAQWKEGLKTTLATAGWEAGIRYYARFFIYARVFFSFTVFIIINFVVLSKIERSR